MWGGGKLPSGRTLKLKVSVLSEGSVGCVCAAGVFCVDVCACAALGVVFRWKTDFGAGSATVFTHAELTAKRETKTDNLVRTTLEGRCGASRSPDHDRV